jgi:hypothetical protein
VSKVEEIETTIRKLSSAERGQLLEDLPSLLSELAGDASWQRILRDTHPRPAFSALLDEVDAERKRNPDAFSAVKESDFNERP